MRWLIFISCFLLCASVSAKQPNPFDQFDEPVKKFDLAQSAGSSKNEPGITMTKSDFEKLYKLIEKTASEAALAKYQVGRFQIIQPGQARADQYLLDTCTGRVWVSVTKGAIPGSPNSGFPIWQEMIKE